MVMCKSAPCTPVKPPPAAASGPVGSPGCCRVTHKVPRGDSPYARAKHVQLIERDPSSAISLFWAAINSGDRVDSALKDMAVVMKQVDRSEEAIEAIKSFRSRCSPQAQEPLNNVLLDLYKRCGRVDDQIELLQHKLKLIDEGSAFGGSCKKLARSQGKKIYVSLEQEKSRLLGNLAWVYMQCENYEDAEPLYRKALEIEPDYNKQCNLAICLMKRGSLTEAKSLLQGIRWSSMNCNKEAFIRSFDRASEMMKDLNCSNLLNELSSPSSTGTWKRASQNQEQFFSRRWKESSQEAADSLASINGGSKFYTPIRNSWTMAGEKPMTGSAAEKYDIKDDILEPKMMIRTPRRIGSPQAKTLRRHGIDSLSASADRKWNQRYEILVAGGRKLPQNAEKLKITRDSSDHADQKYGVKLENQKLKPLIPSPTRIGNSLLLETSDDEPHCSGLPTSTGNGNRRSEISVEEGTIGDDSFKNWKREKLCDISVQNSTNGNWNQRFDMGFTFGSLNKERIQNPDFTSASITENPNQTSCIPNGGRRTWADMVEEEERLAALNQNLNSDAAVDLTIGKWSYPTQEQAFTGENERSGSEFSVSGEQVGNWNQTEAFPDENLNSNVTIGQSTPSRHSPSFDRQPQQDLAVEDYSVLLPESIFEDSGDMVAVRSCCSSCENDLKQTKRRNRLKVFQEITLENSPRA